jgi:two-component system OmpR family sensor kinase
MLGHIGSALAARQASEQKVRTFVSDASHELRTPLASIRGYAELTRRGGHTLPPDVVHAMSRVESESIRMTNLVEELLLLARLDEGRELDSRELDLTQLLEDVVSDARAADAEREWLLELPSEPVSVVGDSSRLHQVFSNLLTNARVHTPAGTTVSTAMTVDAAALEVTVEVHDDGPGVDPAVLDSIFERFVRGDGSRSRAAGSTGLGLAIVRAVVAASGGRVEVESEPGHTVFRVILPFSPPLVAH